MDWQIIDSLIDKPKMPFSDLVISTGLSPKTVRKHLENLLANEVMYILPKLGALADSGELVFHLAVYGKVGLADLRKVIGDTFLINQTQDPPLKYLLCRGTDLGDVTVKTNILRKLPGVESVNVTLNRELLIGMEFIHTLVQEEKASSDRDWDGKEERKCITDVFLSDFTRTELARRFAGKHLDFSDLMTPRSILSEIRIKSSAGTRSLSF